jgi:LuxR family maltose regulon positive regulatory protein
MCAALCDYILGEGSHSQTILEGLDQANLFVVPLDDHGYWYRYHHLFRDFLQTRLIKSHPELVPSFHRQASEWLAEHNFLPEAAQHAFQTQDWDYAASFVERYSFTMIIYSEIATINAWCSAFPEEVMASHPLLCLHQCWAWVFSFSRQNHAKVERRLQQVDRIMAGMEDKHQVHALIEQAGVIRTFLNMAPDPSSNPRKQLEEAQNMLEYYPQGDTGQFSALLTCSYANLALNDAQAANKTLEAARQTALNGQLYFGIVESTFHMARLMHSQGNLRRSTDICRQTRAEVGALLARPEQELPAIGCLDIALGCEELEQDHLVAAEKHLLNGLDMIGRGSNPYYLMTAFVALFRLCEVQDRSAQAFGYLARLEEIWPDIAFFIRSLRITHALRTSPTDPITLAQASAWSQEFSLSLSDDFPIPGMGPFGAAEVYYLSRLAWMRVQIALGNPRAARSNLVPLLEISSANGLMNRVIELSLIEALAMQAENDNQNAIKSLERALAAGQPEGYIRSFDHGADLTKLLIQAGDSGHCPDYIHRILAAIRQPKPLSPSEPDTALRASRLPGGSMPEHLSDRELEILLLMAQGATNQAIADQLVITVGTVKSHINHILGKLDAHNRTEAVARARRLNLV